MDKAAMKPPKDPEGIDCLEPNLCITFERLREILENALDMTMDWLI
jgi:hypothetical protein